MDRQVAAFILKQCDDVLTSNPVHGPGTKCLQTDVYRLEVRRDWRVVYRVEGDTVTVLVAGHRKDIYKRPFW